MNLIDVQYIIDSPLVPTALQFQVWVDSALSEYGKDTEIVIRIIDEQESANLNMRYRHKDDPTNILSFPFESPENMDLNILGDLVICAPIVEQEVEQQHKTIMDHWTHLIVHGVLHLLGYEHLETDQAEAMEAQEIRILKQLNISNPYLEKQDV